VSLTSRRHAWPIAVAADLVVVIVFATVGRSNHNESTGIHGVWHTVWPFALGTVLPLVLTAYARTDPLSLRAGLRVWVWTLVIGMVVRAATGAGTALSFVIVAALVLGALFLGWRWALGWRRWRSRTSWLRRR
jgi:O-antigen/teichoic acid export membrane protein